MKHLTTIVAGLALASIATAQDAQQGQRKLVEVDHLAAAHDMMLQHVHHAQAGNVLVEQQSEPRPMLGVQLSPVSGAVAAQLPEYVEPALILTTIYEGSPAQKAGLEVHDVIASIDGNGDANLEALRASLASRRPGDLVTLEVFRRGRSQMISVVVENFSPPVHQLSGQHEIHIPHVEYWDNYQGPHDWPRFGISPQGGLMIQHQENGDWEATDSNIENHKALQYLLHSGNSTIDLRHPQVDPEGKLREHLDHLRQLHHDKQNNMVFQGNHTKEVQHRNEVLQKRIADLERKLDKMSEMLERLVESTER